MAATWMLARDGLGFTPGSVKYIVTRGLEPTGPVTSTSHRQVRPRWHRSYTALLLLRLFGWC